MLQFLLIEGIKKHALQSQYLSVKDMLDIDAIVPYMCTKHMLDHHEIEDLISIQFTRGKKIDLLIQILMNKSDWWDDWLWCLNESSTNNALTTHKTLAELLECELEQQLKDYKVHNYSAAYRIKT